jgi:hypothetical protein
VIALTVALLGTPSFVSAAPPEVHWQEPLLVASGGGHQGPWRMNESVFEYVDDPAVVLDDQGSAAVVWVDQSGDIAVVNSKFQIGVASHVWLLRARTGPRN